MSHYFSKENDRLPSHPKTIHFKINQKPYLMETDEGVFSKAGLDYGSRVLLEALLPLDAMSVLDLGCGYGPIGIVLNLETSAKVTMVDINPRALELAKKNAALNKVKVEIFESDGFENIHEKYDAIVTNPPIRAGKKIIYGWFKDSIQHLNDTGALYFVIQKKQGAESAIKECESLFKSVEVLFKKSGYFVIKCRNHLTI